MIKYDEPIFDPLGIRVDTNYYPANDLAAEFTNIQFIWRDILTLVNLRSTADSAHSRNLLSKYLVIELCSLDDCFRRFTNSLLRKDRPPVLRLEEVERVQPSFEKYKAIYKTLEKKLKPVRHKMAAHRELIPLHELVGIWDSIEWKRVASLLEASQALVDSLGQIPIYRWTKTGIGPNGEQIMAFVSPIDPDDFSKLRDV